MHYAVDRIPLLQPGLDAVLAEHVQSGTVPATRYAVVHDGRVLASGGFADEDVTPVPTLDTAFRVASCTKSFTAARMLQLRDAGQLDLDAPVDDVLPLTLVPAGRPTVRQLATMAAGFPTDDPWADRQESMTAATLESLAAEGLRTTLPPGSAFQYSNLGFALLGLVLERVDGRPFVRQVQEELLVPLGLDGTGFDRDVPAPDGVAVGFAKGPAGWEPQPFSSPGAFSPIGGLFATARALATWTSWLASATKPGADDAVLAASSRLEMQRGTVPVDPDDAYGFGLVATRRTGRVPGAPDRRFVSHSGGYPGYGAHFRWHDDSRIGIVVLENARYSGAAVPARRALEAVLDAVSVPDAVPAVWPETLTARRTVESLLRAWDPRAAGELFADNVHRDEPLARRREHLEALAAAAGIDRASPVSALLDAAPASENAAHLAWTSAGRTGALRLHIRLTPEPRPRVQTLVVRQS